MTKLFVAIVFFGLAYFIPPISQMIDLHPECSVATFSPDLTQKQRAFCREWRNHGQK
jgi:hypothetical protein